MKMKEKMRKKNWTTFLNSPEGRELIWLDYCGYHLCKRQVDMTIRQVYVISKGRLDLHNEMNKVK